MSGEANNSRKDLYVRGIRQALDSTRYRTSLTMGKRFMSTDDNINEGNFYFGRLALKT